MEPLSLIVIIAIIIFVIYLYTNDKTRSAIEKGKMDIKLKEKKELEDFEEAEKFVEELSSMSHDERVDAIVRFSNANPKIFGIILQYKMLNKFNL